MTASTCIFFFEIVYLDTNFLTSFFGSLFINRYYFSFSFHFRKFFKKIFFEIKIKTFVSLVIMTLRFLTQLSELYLTKIFSSFGHRLSAAMLNTKQIIIVICKDIFPIVWAFRVMFVAS